jgi:hypothetical protein
LIQNRRDTAATWTSVNPILASGEIGVETDTNKFKIGDGTSTWSALAYQGGSGTAHGIPSGGTTGQVLSKVNSTDYNVQWSTVSGGASSFYGTYTGTTWTVNHNLGYQPAITTMDNALTPNQVEGTINHIDANNLTVTFTTTVTGTIYLS